MNIQVLIAYFGYSYEHKTWHIEKLWHKRKFPFNWPLDSLSPLGPPLGEHKVNLNAHNHLFIVFDYYWIGLSFVWVVQHTCWPFACGPTWYRVLYSILFSFHFVSFCPNSPICSAPEFYSSLMVLRMLLLILFNSGYILCSGQ